MSLDDDNVMYEKYLEKIYDAIKESSAAGYAICHLDYAKDQVLKLKLPFKLGEIDQLNFMMSKRQVENIGGWTFEYEADFHIIRRVFELSEGAFVSEILGCHR